MKTTITKTINEVTLTLEGNFYPATLGSWEEPPEPASFEPEKIYIQKNGDRVDVTDLIFGLEEFGLNSYSIWESEESNLESEYYDEATQKNL